MTSSLLLSLIALLPQATDVAPPVAAAPELHEDLQYREGAGPPRRHRLDLFVPSQDARPEAGWPVVLFVHGGAWTGGKKEHFHGIGVALAHRGFAAAVANTRQFPFARPPEMAEDVAAALGYLHREGAAHGCDPARLFVMGHSSGAHLCSWVAYEPSLLQEAGVPREALCGAVLLSGVYDVRAHHFALDPVFGSDMQRRRDATTWLRAGADAPPTLLLWGGRDMPGLSLCARMLRDRLEAHRVPVRAVERAEWDHVRYLFRVGTADDELLPEVLPFLRAPGQSAEAQPAEGAVAPVAAESRRCVVWIASDDEERRLGERLAAAGANGAFEVVVEQLAPVDVDAEGAARTFRKVQAARRAVGAAPPTHLAAVGGRAAAAVARAPSERDGLLGRILIGPLPASVAGEVTEQRLGQAALLTVCGERDPEPIQQASVRAAVRVFRGGGEGHAIELLGTSGRDAVAAMEPGDDLLLPMLRAFVGP